MKRRTRKVQQRCQLRDTCHRHNLVWWALVCDTEQRLSMGYLVSSCFGVLAEPENTHAGVIFLLGTWTNHSELTRKWRLTIS
jgi:hypothetical protein